MHYENYQPEDFLKDDNFIQWIRNPTDAQIIFWEKWLLQHPEKSEAVAKAREIVLSVRYRNHYQPSEADMKAVWQNIQSGERSNVSPKQWSLIPALPSMMRYAAAVVIVSLISLLTWNYSQRRQSLETGLANVKPGIVQYKTERGQKRKVSLPDGSIITLNADSRITYQSDFGSRERNVDLIGEAFFEVAPNPAKPFNIKTGALTTTVVGTSFNINSYEGNGQIRVAVVTGKVKVAAQSQTVGEKEVMLLPNEMSVFEKGSGDLREQGYNKEKEIGWVNSVIILENADFEEIKNTLERNYAVTFVVDKGLKVKEDFSAKFKVAPIRKVLDALNYTSRFQYNLVKDKVYVTKKDEK
jgi:transmembrane sensor